MPRALLSVHDKTGIVAFAQRLAASGWELIASGGTARLLTEAGLPTVTVEQVTGHPEILGGRVKTLHPAIHAGILSRATAADQEALATLDYQQIDMVVCNLYPFEETTAQAGVTLAQAIEQIDIGGVTLLRAAAKNFDRVWVVTAASDYDKVLDAVTNAETQSPEAGLSLRRKLASAAFRLTSHYDTLIAAYLDAVDAQIPDFGLPFDVSGIHVEKLRYGENPHQEGWYLAEPGSTSAALGGQVLGGKLLSYNNLLDLDAAWRALELFSNRPSVVIVKHLSPCGIATAETLTAAFESALAADPVSAFGGVVAVNQPVDEAFVAALGDLFLEAIVAPAFTEAAQTILAEKRKNLRLLHLTPQAKPERFEFRSVRGGLLVQTIDHGDPTDAAWKVVTKRQPTPAEQRALEFAWRAAQAVKSNAIVLAVGEATVEATVGLGGGLPSRVDAAKLAVEKAGDRARGAVLASDAFFPFPDALEVGIQAGITAAIAPGGSIRDEQVIAAADAAGIAMIFTGVRHFRH